MTRSQPKCDAAESWLVAFVPDPETRFIWQRSSELVLAQANVIWPDLIYVLCQCQAVRTVATMGASSVRVNGHTLDGVALTVDLVIYEETQTLKIIGIATG